MGGHEELLEVVNYKGEVIGILPRSHIHGNPSLVHRVVHVLVFNSKGELLLQKRSLTRDVAPGKWDTSVGGHINPGEDPLEAARREMKEELGEIFFNREEIDKVKFWGLEEINKNIGKNILSDNFENEISTYLQFLGNTNNTIKS